MIDTKENLLRTCYFHPYLKGMGPTFKLQTWDTGQRGEYGKVRIAYRLTAHENGKRTTLFEGNDFFCSPMHYTDSDDCVKSLMVFLTLRPGDTDKEYFDGYTPVQLDYASQHAESLSCAVHDRFGWDD